MDEHRREPRAVAAAEASSDLPGPSRRDHRAPVFAGPATDLRLLFASRLLRMFGYGLVGVVLVLHLAAIGLSPSRIGSLLALTLFGDVAISLWLSTHADRWGRRRTLVLGAALMVLGGAGMALTSNFVLLVLAATIGVISPTGNEVGPFLAVEHAGLAQSVSAARRTSVFAWYNLAGYFATAVGALVAGGVAAALQHRGWSAPAAYRLLFGAYAVLGVALGLLATSLSSRLEVPASAAPPPAGVWLGLHESRGFVLRLSALFALDSFGGGFILQSFLAWWLHQRYGASDAVLGSIFFGTNLFSGLSGLVAVALARRFGLVNTMVWTHLPSNVLLALVPLMPNLPLAIGMLLARHLLSQMDVPTRQSYINAMVAPGERSAANGITTTAKQLGTALGPLVSGPVLRAAALTGLPFYLGGGIKVVYDLLLWRAFRQHRPPEERPVAR
jgi:MFS family permease